MKALFFCSQLLPNFTLCLIPQAVCIHFQMAGLRTAITVSTDTVGTREEKREQMYVCNVITDLKMTNSSAGKQLQLTKNRASSFRKKMTFSHSKYSKETQKSCENNVGAGVEVKVGWRQHSRPSSLLLHNSDKGRSVFCMFWWWLLFIDPKRFRNDAEKLQLEVCLPLLNSKAGICALDCLCWLSSLCRKLNGKDTRLDMGELKPAPPCVQSCHTPSRLSVCDRIGGFPISKTGSDGIIFFKPWGVCTLGIVAGGWVYWAGLKALSSMATGILGTYQGVWWLLDCDSLTQPAAVWSLCREAFLCSSSSCPSLCSS